VCVCARTAAVYIARGDNVCEAADHTSQTVCTRPESLQLLIRLLRTDKLSAATPSTGVYVYAKSRHKYTNGNSS